MADGTIKQLNPFTDTEVWSVPGRSSRPILREQPVASFNITDEDRRGFCSFCETRILETPPEKARVILNSSGQYEELRHVMPEEYPLTHWLFRRVPNLFEIVTVDYWKKNYAYVLSEPNLKWKEAYLSSPAGRDHVVQILDYKLRANGLSENRLAGITEEEKLSLSDAFFGGGHELIIASPHFAREGNNGSQLFSSGEMTPEEHFQYFKFTVNAMQDIFQSNHYVRYISVFQNWLAPAGASLDHLHKQLVGLDDWGASIRHQIDMLRHDANVFNEFAANLSAMHNLVFAENEHAIAFVGIGHRNPTLEIFSKSRAARPYEHSPEELRGVSDLVHACHAAMSSKISCNEEWYYSPIDSVNKMPWHVLIKWRVNTQAGFEGGTSIYINPIAPHELRDKMVPRLFLMREEGKVDRSMRIAEECHIYPNPLRYYLD
jgi:galactose-1-phosphate uridylyltransferase